MKIDINNPSKWIVAFGSLALLIIATWNSFLSTGYEGGWILYSKALNSGADLHKDLGYLLPGFYPKFHTAIFNFFGENELLISLFGIFLFVVFFLLVRALYIKQSNNINGWEIWAAALLTCSIVFLFKPFRVNDYHLISLLGILAATLMLLSGRIWVNYLSLFPVVIVMSNRVHDGLALALACCMVMAIRNKNFFNILLFVISVTLGAYLFIDAIDPQYLHSDILSDSAKTKGLSVYGVILILAKDIVQNVAYFFITIHGAFAAGLIAIWKISSDSLERKGKDNSLITLFCSFIFSVVFFHNPSVLIMTISFLSFAVFLYALMNYKKESTSNYFILLLIFFSYFSSSSLSSFGNTFEFGPQCSLLVIALVFFSMEKGFWRSNAKNIKYFVSVLSISIFLNILYMPFGWHIYSSPNLGSGAELSRGRLVKSTVAIFSEKICPVIEGKDVFSLPFSFYTYHCDAKPWQNAISTFYDTSNKAWIAELVKKLNANPPEYIVYTRQLGNLKSHSKLYGKGRPLEQEKFDQIIFDRIAEGKWKIILIAALDGDILYDLKRDHNFPKIIDPLDINFKDNLIYLISTKENG